MDTTITSQVLPSVLTATNLSTAVLDRLLAALKLAIEEPGEHRLYRSGKLAGLFPERAGINAEAASHAIQHGLFEVVRTETKGRIIFDWVRITPRGVRFVHDHDSPKAVLHDLRILLGETRQGVPTWMQDFQEQFVEFSVAILAQVRELTEKLDNISHRVEAAIRRADAQPLSVSDGVKQLVPWALPALEYLDQRLFAGMPRECPLAELFEALRDDRPNLPLQDFLDGLKRMHEVKAVQLKPASEHHQRIGELDPVFAVLVGPHVCQLVVR